MPNPPAFNPLASKLEEAPVPQACPPATAPDAGIRLAEARARDHQERRDRLSHRMYLLRRERRWVRRLERLGWLVAAVMPIGAFIAWTQTEFTLSQLLGSLFSVGLCCWIAYQHQKLLHGRKKTLDQELAQLRREHRAEERG